MSARAARYLKWFLLLPIVSCGGEDEHESGDGKRAFGNALIDCGLLTPGQFGPADMMVDPLEDCLGECLAGGSCTELEQIYCSDGPEPEGAALFEPCLQQCTATYGHDCDGQTLSPSLKCDGFEDCSDGSDELGCSPPFMCGDGSLISPSWTCDGDADCEDSSDELDCPAQAMFTCDDDSQIRAELQCDTKPDCADSSDEAGCAMKNCPG